MEHICYLINMILFPFPHYWFLTWKSAIYNKQCVPCFFFQYTILSIFFQKCLERHCIVIFFLFFSFAIQFSSLVYLKVSLWWLSLYRMIDTTSILRNFFFFLILLCDDTHARVCIVSKPFIIFSFYYLSLIWSHIRI